MTYKRTVTELNNRGNLHLETVVMNLIPQYDEIDPLKNALPKWQLINYSSVCMLISPLRLVNMYQKQKNFEVKMRRRGLINRKNSGLNGDSIQAQCSTI